MMMSSPWLSILCPSCRPDDLARWLDTLWATATAPDEIEVSVTYEQTPRHLEYERWGYVSATKVNPGQYSVNELSRLCYIHSSAPYVMLSGDDTVCRTKGWDWTFRRFLAQYPDGVALCYPDDTILGAQLSVYPVTSRLVMDAVPWPVPYPRYCIDDTIMDIVPEERRVFLPEVVFEHLHISDKPPGHPVERNGRIMFCPYEPEVLSRDAKLFQSLAPERAKIREALRQRMGSGVYSDRSLGGPMGPTAQVPA